MGAIQNSINQMTGAIAGAALGVKHVKEQELSNVQQAESQALIAQGQAFTASTEADKATAAWEAPGGGHEKIIEAENKVDKASEAYENSAPGLDRLKAFTALDAANRAYDQLAVEEKSILGMQERAAAMRAHAEKMSSLSAEKSNRFARRWGGAK